MPLPFTRRGIDPDAADFCSRSGASDRAAVSAFVRGVKDLGLYNSMVCWPLRSTQNAGTGDTVYSLGGLGTFNGMRVNGPTWGTEGLLLASASSQSVSTMAVVSIGSSGAVYTTTGGSSQALLSNRPNTPAWDNGASLFAREANDATALVDIAGVAGSRMRATGTPSLSQYVFTQATHTLVGTNVPANTTFRQNKSSRSTGSYVLGSNENMAASVEPVRIAAANTAGSFGHFNGTMSFVFVSPQNYTAATQESLFDLYKTTLGTGLGLP
jgi:hypothetical protein